MAHRSEHLRSNNHAMRKSMLTKASERRSDYAVEGEKYSSGDVRSPKPVSAVIPLQNTGAETVALSTNKNFIAIIEKSRSSLKKHDGISPKELRRRLGLKK